LLEGEKLGSKPLAQLACGARAYGVVFVVVVLPAVAGALAGGCAVVEAGVVVVAGAAVFVVVPGGVLVAPVEDGVVVDGVTGSPGFGSGLEVMPAMNSLSPASEPFLYL
jgi:hypothetical protein